MGRIHLLDDDVINKIAAGEVVERPASVVKELVENALDAGASRIDVALELGGTRRIAVTDDGLGMGHDDARAALTRHATSKIAKADDLFQIQTMGFRGEALASIASVSRFCLATSEREAAEGVKLTLDGGEGLATWPWSGAPGSTVTVENLFFNMPVRAKFLKAPATEFSHCLELMQAFALSRPDIAFSVTHNGREQFRVAASTRDEGAAGFGERALRERAKSVLGKDAASLQYVKTGSRFGEVEALVSPPGIEKGTGKALFTFVNGRWVKDKVLRYGILRGYHSHLLKGRFPIVTLHLRLDPSLVDVNVHPAKTEVRFQYPDEVQSLIALGIRERLRDATWAQPEEERPAVMDQPSAAALAATRAPVPEQRRLAFEGASIGRGTNQAPAPARLVPGTSRTSRSFGGARGGDFSFESRPVGDKAGIDAMIAGMGSDGEPAEPEIAWEELEFLGAYDRCYLFFNAGPRLLVVDQHAFHERILFERLTRDVSLLTQSQQLLVPESIELAPSEVATLRERWAALSVRGFDFMAEGETTILVRAVPSLLVGRDLAELFADLGKEFGDFDVHAHEPHDSNAETLRLILAKTACHAAVRSGEELPANELRQLLGEARTVDFFHNCPHGRRVFRWWSRSEVGRWFDR